MSSRWVALGVLCTSLLAIVIDNTIVNVALPTISRDLAASNSGLQWVVDAYTLTFAGLLLTAGHFADRFGRRRLLVIGVTGFAGSVVTRRATMTSATTSAVTMMTAIQPPWRFGGRYWLMSGGWFMVALLYVVARG